MSYSIQCLDMLLAMFPLLGLTDLLQFQSLRILVSLSAVYLDRQQFYYGEIVWLYTLNDRVKLSITPK